MIAIGKEKGPLSTWKGVLRCAQDDRALEVRRELVLRMLGPMERVEESLDVAIHAALPHLAFTESLSAPSAPE